MTAKVFRAKPRDRRYRVEYRSSIRGWVLDDTYRTYFMARWQVAVWNSIGHDARIIDTRDGDID